MADDTVAKALKTALTVTAVTQLATGGVWRNAAKQGTARPFVVFQFVGGTPTEHTFTRKVDDDHRWQLDAYADDSVTADAIIAAIEEALFDNALPVTGVQTLYCRKDMDLPAPPAFDGEQMVHRRSQQWRIVVAD
jgi:hypothetical protein